MAPQQPQINTDSRTVKPGQTFIAIQGDTFDGHSFIAQAVEKGATEIVAETAKLTPQLRKAIPSTVKLTEVKSSMDEIRARAHAYRKQFSIPFIAVVGSVGKTTTKELIASLLRGKYDAVLKTEGSQNGFLGIPLTLLTLKPETQIAVIEVGIDDIGAMDQHMKLVEPTHVILTALGPEHLHQLKTVEIATKEELKAFDYALAHSLPIAVNLTEDAVRTWWKANGSKSSSSKTYSLKNEHKPYFLGEYDGQKNSLTVKHDSDSVTLSLPLPGEHHAHNLLAAVTLTQFFSLTKDQIQKGLATFKTAYGRTETQNLPQGTLVIGDYYNSNPTSVVAALKLLREKTNAGGKSHAVLGDMLELGDGEEKFHRALADTLIKEKVAQVWLYGTRMKWLKDELSKNKGAVLSVHHFDTHEALAKALQPTLTAKDTVLIKGSRGMKMENVLKALS